MQQWTAVDLSGALTTYAEMCAQERAKFEAEALLEEARHCPEHVPELYHYDAALCLLVMQVCAATASHRT